MSEFRRKGIRFIHIPVDTEIPAVSFLNKTCEGYEEVSSFLSEHENLRVVANQI